MSSRRPLEQDPFYNALRSRRRLCALGYGLVMAGVVVLTFWRGPSILAWEGEGIMLATQEMGMSRMVDEGAFADAMDEDGKRAPLGVAVFFLAFFATQALFLWGGGRVTIQREKTGAWRLVLPVAVFAVFAAALTGLGVALVLEAMSALPEFESAWTWLVCLWGLWGVLGVLYWRGRNQARGLWSMVHWLVAGSWIEFCLALPVHAAARVHGDECPCALPSYMILVFSLPLMLWAFGPGIVLLYLGERSLERESPGHARNVLLKRTRVAPRRKGPDG